MDQATLMALGTAASAAIGTLFWQLLKAKDAHIHELRETVRYQRGVYQISAQTAHRAVGVLEEVA